MASLTLNIETAVAGDDGTYGVSVNGVYMPFLFPSESGGRTKRPIDFEVWEEVAGPVDGVTCPLCLTLLLPKPMKRKVGSNEGPDLPLHPNCRHYWEPIIDDLKPNKETFDGYIERIERPPTVMMKAIGPVRAAMIKEADVELSDLYDLEGPVPRLRSIAELNRRKRRIV